MRGALIAVIPLLFAIPALADEPGPGAAELEKCKICHALGESGSHVGPTLHGVFGRKAGTADYTYSEAMKASGIVWEDETMAKYLRDPKGSMPGTKMSFPGIKDEATLRDLVQRMKQATQ
jgi:cytochrome c